MWESVSEAYRRETPPCTPNAPRPTPNAPPMRRANLVDLVQLGLLLGQRAQRPLLLALVELRAAGLLQQREDLRGLHVHDLMWGWGWPGWGWDGCRWSSCTGWWGIGLWDEQDFMTVGCASDEEELPPAQTPPPPAQPSTHVTCPAPLHTLVTRPCMIRKCGLLTFSCTDWNRSATRLCVRVCVCVCVCVLSHQQASIGAWTENISCCSTNRFMRSQLLSSAATAAAQPLPRFAQRISLASPLLCRVAVDQVLVTPADDNLRG